ncbi:MAG TPA: HEPN domain-containing protein [archaeon]|nr:HEPN domain-containing protein [archaeon]
MTSEQAALLKKAQASLEASRLLSGQGFFDFAVSRAYYAMFYVAETLLLGEGLAYSKHSAVISDFGKRFTKSGRVPPEFHRFLIEGQESRNVGDYDIKPGLGADEAMEQISRAEKFMELAERLIGPFEEQE